MTKQFRIWASIVDSLLESTTDAYNNGNMSLYPYLLQEINQIIRGLNSLEYKDRWYSFELLDHRKSSCMSELLRAQTVLRQMRNFLIVVSGEDIVNNKKLENEISELNTKIRLCDEKESKYLEIIENCKSSSSFQFDYDSLKGFTGNNLKLMHEAVVACSVGAYTACVCICRNILQEMIQDLCKKNSVSGGSLKDQINKLVEKNVIKTKQHSQLIEVATIFGNRAAHPTTETFNKEKASLLLNTLTIINNEVIVSNDNCNTNYQ